MSTHRPHIDRGTAEHLLGSAPAPARAGAEPLSALLAAAAAPAQPGELAGKQAVIAAFQAHRHPVHPPRRRSMLKIALARLLTVKVAAAAVLAVGGVALAASTGVLSPSFGAPKGTPTPAPATGKPDATRSTGPHASPSPSLGGLCKAFGAMPAGNRGKALESPAFQALISAADGKDKVTAFCQTLSAAEPTTGAGGPPSTHPNIPAAGVPTSAPTSPHAGAQTAAPSAAASHH